MAVQTVTGVDFTQEDLDWAQKLPKSVTKALPEVLEKLNGLKKTDAEKYQRLKERTSKKTHISEDDLEELVKGNAEEHAKLSRFVRRAFGYILPNVQKANDDNSISDFSDTPGANLKLVDGYLNVMNVMKKSRYNVGSVIKDYENAMSNLRNSSGSVSSDDLETSEKKYNELAEKIAFAIFESGFVSIKDEGEGKKYLSIDINSKAKSLLLEPEIDKKLKELGLEELPRQHSRHHH